MKSEAKAKKIGKQVKKRLGKGWDVQVWNNLGWHARWRKESVSLYRIPCGTPNARSKSGWDPVYKILIIGSGNEQLALKPSATCYDRDPVKAVRMGIAEMKQKYAAHLARLDKIMAPLDGVLEELR